MALFLIDSHGRRIGPYSPDELRLFAARGLLEPAAVITEEGTGRTWTLAEFLGEPGGARREIPPGAVEGAPMMPPGPSVSPPVEQDATRGGDFLSLVRHLMLPLEDLLRLRWLDNRRILALAVVGLLPLFLIVYLQRTSDLVGCILGVALYSSLLWALFFYAVFSQPQVTVLHCVLAYLGSAVFSISLVALGRMFVPLSMISPWISSPNITIRWLGHLGGVALLEEAAKLFMLYFLWPRRPLPKAMMFYGLMAGLGFGIYEGVTYQASLNLHISMSARNSAEAAGIYYLLNVLRLTSLPFLHAMWTGIAGYFIGFAGQYPSRRGGLLAAAIVVPCLLHATYNTFSLSWIGLAVAVVTVLALSLYVVKGRDFEAVLAGTASRNRAGLPPRESMGGPWNESHRGRDDLS